MFPDEEIRGVQNVFNLSHFSMISNTATRALLRTDMRSSHARIDARVHANSLNHLISEQFSDS